jgi:hypothetical protein
MASLMTQQGQKTVKMASSRLTNETPSKTKDFCEYQLSFIVKYYLKIALVLIDARFIGF